ncbi:TetR/AcrR family transcriptional regulator [Salinispira pacifica]|uniref:Transcriptional regulator, TetR family n=1 Tax=Salinispira pacifica TaxID=1307761 RepID=V5WEX3_9SPIO|nr:TetR family transcriptional regulator [Salinispira pacifica]AHC14084.1 Transcriptional regulator, TetR family [Salinispira pacifica]
MSWKRARSEDQKAERILAIQDAAGSLFLSADYHSIGLEQIAKRAGFTRPNLYRYYRSKEEIFLAILQRDLESWVGEMESDSMSAAALKTGGEPGASSAFAGWWVKHFTAQPRLPRLLPLMSFSLDDNAGEELLREFKLHLADISLRIAEIVRSRLPWYPAEALADFPTMQLALVTGLMPMATRSEVHNRVLEDPRLRIFAIDFETRYRKVLEQFILGVQCRQDADRAARDAGQYRDAGQ